MQTAKDPEVILAGTQSPLLTSAQLVPGAVVTGIAAVHAWAISRVEGEVVELSKMGSPPLTHVHTFAQAGQRGQACACGVRRQPVRDLLPLKEGKARVYVIVPKDGAILSAVSTSATYASLGKGGALAMHTLTHEGKWSTPLPLIPELHKVWDLPEALTAFLTTEAAQAPNEEE